MKVTKKLKWLALLWVAAVTIPFVAVAGPPAFDLGLKIGGKIASQVIEKN